MLHKQISVRSWLLRSLFVVAIALFIAVLYSLINSSSAYICRGFFERGDMNNVDIHGNLQPITRTNLSSITQLRSFDLHSVIHGGYDIEFSPNQTYLAMSTLDDHRPFVQIWNIYTKELCQLSLRDIDITTYFIAFSSDGSFVITKNCRGDTDDSCYDLWDVNAGVKVGEFKYAEFIQFPDAQYLSYPEPNQPDRRFLELPSREVTQNIPISLRNARLFSHDGGSFITLTEEGDVQIWNTQTQQLILTLADSKFTNEREEVVDIAFSPDDYWLVSRNVGDGIKVRIWNTQTGNLMLEPSNCRSRNFDFTQDSRRFICGNEVWDIENQEIVMQLHDMTFYDMSMDGSLFATLSDNHASILDTNSGEILLSFDTARLIKDVNFSADGKLLALATWEQRGPYPFGVVEIWGIPQS